MIFCVSYDRTCNDIKLIMPTLLILLFTQSEVLVGVILIILVAIVYFLYHIGYILVLHNIMDLSLDDGHEINSVKI